MVEIKENETKESAQSIYSELKVLKEKNESPELNSFLGFLLSAEKSVHILDFTLCSPEKREDYLNSLEWNKTANGLLRLLSHEMNLSLQTPFGKLRRLSHIEHYKDKVVFLGEDLDLLGSRTFNIETMLPRVILEFTYPKDSDRARTITVVYHDVEKNLRRMLTTDEALDQMLGVRAKSKNRKINSFIDFLLSERKMTHSVTWTMFSDALLPEFPFKYPEMEKDFSPDWYKTTNGVLHILTGEMNICLSTTVKHLQALSSSEGFRESVKQLSNQSDVPYLPSFFSMFVNYEVKTSMPNVTLLFSYIPYEDHVFSVIIRYNDGRGEDRIFL